LVGALRESLATDPLALFSGLLPRCAFFGGLIAGQFLLVRTTTTNHRPCS
jgi:hypothetical protein